MRLPAREQIAFDDKFKAFRTALPKSRCQATEVGYFWMTRPVPSKYMRERHSGKMRLRVQARTGLGGAKSKHQKGPNQVDESMREAGMAYLGRSYSLSETVWLRRDATRNPLYPLVHPAHLSL